jgi:uncharacterized BrkB/YihY/UPF0761 family membrane protein
MFFFISAMVFILGAELNAAILQSQREGRA